MIVGTDNPIARLTAAARCRIILRDMIEPPPMQVDKIHDLRRHLGTVDEHGVALPMRNIKGVINHRVTRVIAFIVIAAALIACAAICVMALWGYVASDFAWRALASFGIISGAMAIFVALNEGFGPSVREH